MGVRPSYYRLLLILSLVFGLPSLACNFPFNTPTPAAVPELQHTLTALAVLRTEVQTPLPAIAENQAPLPAISTPTAPRATLTIDIPSPPALDASGEVYSYQVYPGDTLQAVAKRFAVEPGQISSAGPIPPQGLLTPGQVLFIPNQVGETRYAEILLPDSEVINSPSAQDFQIEAFIYEAGGYLSRHSELVNGSQLSGADILTKVSLENSINPRLLLAILEYRSGWVYGDLVAAEQLDYPIGFYVPDYQGLYYELVLTATHLGVGYYGWRTGDTTALAFQDGSYISLSPGLNAGTAALQVAFSKISSPDEWRNALYAEGGFMDLYAVMFGDPWLMAAETGVLYPADITQPALSLPFSAGERWGFTGGPHRSWNAGSPRGALDFSPVTGEPACTTSRAWVTASAPGVITRISDSVLVLDLDGDGHEQTGWVLVYLHLVPADDIQPGSQVAADQRLGHPSCERGKSTGTHVHLARKYNGEWLPAGDPFTFSLSGWRVVPGEKSYQGELQKGGRSITANPGGPGSSLIIREE